MKYKFPFLSTRFLVHSAVVVPFTVLSVIEVLKAFVTGPLTTPWFLVLIFVLCEVIERLIWLLQPKFWPYNVKDSPKDVV